MQAIKVAIHPDIHTLLRESESTRRFRFIKAELRDIDPETQQGYEKQLALHSKFQSTFSAENDANSLTETLSNLPAYILATLDDSGTKWIGIYYLPDVPDGLPDELARKERRKLAEIKIIYASSHKSLKDAFPSIFPLQPTAISKPAEFSTEYTSHLTSFSAPPPMSREEQERSDVRAGENAARVGGFLGGLGVGLRGTDVPVLWRNKGESEGEGFAEKAVAELGGAAGLVVLTTDPANNVLSLDSSTHTTSSVIRDVPIEQIWLYLPKDKPCYAFFSHPSIPYIILISSYPETVTSFLNRGGAFIHSSGINSVRSTAESLLPSGKGVKKVDVRDEEELKEKLGDFVSSTAGAGSGTTETAAISAGGGGQGQLKFARPTRPGGKKR